MGTVIQTAEAVATAYSNQRRTDRTSNGVLWAITNVADPASAYGFAAEYSTDGGATWSNTGTFLNFGNSRSYQQSGSLFIDSSAAGGDAAAFIFRNPSSGIIRVIWGTPNSARTAYAWSSAVDLTDSYRYDFPDIAVARNPSGTGWVALAVYDVLAASNYRQVIGSLLSISDAGAITVTQSEIGISASYQNANAPTYPSVDLNHAGDGKTVKNGAPHWYVGWSAAPGQGYNSGIRFRKGTYSGGSWTWSSEISPDSSRYVAGASDWLLSMWDGSRWTLTGWTNSPGGYNLFVYDIDPTTLAATTSGRVFFNAPAAAQKLDWGSATYNSAGDIYAFGAGNSALGYNVWNRASNSLGARQGIDPTVGAPYASARRGPQGNAIDYVYTDGTASPYTVTSGRIVLNVAPTAATPTTPTTGSSVDRTQPITLAWVFNDPDAGDSQSKSDIRYKLTSASTWTTILGATTTATSYALPANQTAGNYEWQVLTYDALGVASPWSSSSFFTAADPPGVPVITAPSNGDTIATASYTVTWSSPTQEAYEVRRVADNAGSPNTGTVYFTTGAVVDGTSRARTLTFDTNNRTEHVQVRVRYQGIWSQWADARVLVSYTPPATPTVTLTVQDATASILVTITNPTPSGSQPTVASHDILIDDGFGEGLTRRVTGWAPGAAWTYWLPVSGRPYEGNIRVVAVATNNTTSTGIAT